MGGLSGHMMHPHDNHNLTIGKFKNLLAGAMHGHLRMTEKIDGFNIHYMKYNGELRLARNGKDIMEGGFGYNDIDDRFSNDRVRSVFRKAYEILRDTIDLDDLSEFMVSSETVNAEIVIDGITNIMVYGENRVISHNRWRWSGAVGKPLYDDDEYPKNQPFLSYKPLNWHQVRDMINQLTADEFAPLGLNEAATIREYYAIRFMLVMQELFPKFIQKYPAVAILLFNRFMGIDKTNLREIRKMSDMDISPILAAEKKIMQAVKEPLDRWVLQIGTTMLEQARGFNHEKQCYYTAAAELEDSIATTEQNETFKRRWGYCDNKIFGMEGLVVEFEDDLYKFTGPFAPINQLLGGNRK